MYDRENRFSSKRGQRSFGRGGRPRAGRPQTRIKYMQVDPQALIKQAVPKVASEHVPQHQFADFPLGSILQANILAKGYTTPTAIQDQALPLVLAGKDVIGLAATGTGKTAVFLLPIINRVIKERDHRAIVITPTRELAAQIVDEGRAFARDTRCYFSLLIGGVDLRRQIQDMKRGGQVIVGTPGRIKDLAERGNLRLADFQTVVLDEVDRMLDMGFIGDIQKIISSLPQERHSLFFSATMSDKIKHVAQSFLTNPVTIRVESQGASCNINQDVVKLAGRNKLDVLQSLLSQPGFDKVLVFGRTKRGAEKLSRLLSQRGFVNIAIHGNKNQRQRQRALDAFKRNRFKIMIATDVAARGLDVDNITHVINYELPETYEDYIHRIGRTGRADRTGVALTFID